MTFGPLEIVKLLFDKGAKKSCNNPLLHQYFKDIINNNDDNDGKKPNQ